jgi:hypothetical protein
MQGVDERMTEESVYKKIDLNAKINFKPLHNSFGRAEFEFCPVFKRGKMTDLFITRRQQDNYENYHLPLKELGFNNTTDFAFNGYDSSEGVRAWGHYWCKFHKAICFKVYVPNDTDTINFSYFFGYDLEIIFTRENK